jgi:hypothetical protein
METGKMRAYAVTSDRRLVIAPDIPTIAEARDMPGDPRRDACAARRLRRHAIDLPKGASQTVHGPRNWDHFNEAGYRILGKLLADRINNKAADLCDDEQEP